MSPDSKVLHRIIRKLTDLTLSSFFTEIRVIGGEHVPRDGPIIVTATHHNMILDPAVLSSSFPHRRVLNYWSKASLFTNPIVTWILVSSGNIPVERKSKDRNVLFKGTFEALSKGEAVALFPEGTSYTEPRIMQVKDGASWAALEYARWRQDKPGVPDKDVTIIPACIVYTDKSKYRSAAIVEFGQPIPVAEYKEQFLSQEEGAQKTAVKRLTRKIEEELLSASINAPDWDTLYAARMTRELLWEQNSSINLDDFVSISQTLVDLFAAPNPTSNVLSVKRHLLEYYSLLQSSRLTNSVLTSLPLPRSLDPNSPTPLPSRLYTLMLLIRDTLVALIRLPFFIFPLLLHLPVYFMGRFGAGLAKEEEETQAQNKVVFGLLSSFLVYPTTFFFLWSLMWYTPIGAVIAVATVYLFATSHTRLIDENYDSAKRLASTWRILVGVWVPKQWDLSLTALSQYTTPVKPKASAWIQFERMRSLTRDGNSDSNSDSSSALAPTNDNTTVEPPVKIRPRRRAPSRRLVRHVLRARIQAIRSIASFFDHLQRTQQGAQLPASVHLARAYGNIRKVGVDQVTGWPVEEGSRNVHEIVDFLTGKGAKIPGKKQAANETEWGNFTSDPEIEGDGNTSVAETDES